MNKPFTIAFIDDEEMLCSLIKLIIKTEAIKLITYTSPFLAIQECNENPPDLIFTDFWMPGINGLLLAKKMPSNIPIYLVSGGDIDLKLDFPFSGIIDKPYNLELINAIINDVMKLRIAKVA